MVIVNFVNDRYVTRLGRCSRNGILIRAAIVQLLFNIIYVYFY